jgi:hypothetical protein
LNGDLWIYQTGFLYYLLAALYAKWASYEAKRSNDVAFLTQKIEIYKEFLALKNAVIQRSERINITDTSKFYFPHIYSEFFYSESTHNKIKHYFEICFEIADNSEGHTKVDELKRKEKKLVVEVEQLMKNELKSAVKRRNWMV